MIDINQMKVLFSQAYGKVSEPVYCFFAPGRVNLIGEYTDFNGGYVFPAAISLGIYGALRFRSDNLIQMKSSSTTHAIRVDLDKPVLYSEQDGWGNYPKGIIKYLLDNGAQLRGCDILYSGNLPDGAGLSSSAAILVLTAFMLQYAGGGVDANRPALAKFCQKVENEFIKVNCGIMDQFSVAMGRQDCAILLDCHNLKHEYIPFVLREHNLVIMNTNKKRELADSKYNQRRYECEQALDIIRSHRPITYLCQASPSDVATYLANDVLHRRARHIVLENNRVIEAVKFLKQGNIAAFGGLMTESHMSLKYDFEVTGPELDAIVDYALQFPGCIGARMTGAGFGGCAIALVESSRLEEFKAAVLQGYKANTGRIPDFYVAGISDGVKMIEC
jgi:galactokinase